MTARTCLLFTRSLALIMIAVFPGGANAKSQQETNTSSEEEMVAVLTRYEVEQGHREKLRKVLGKYVKRVHRLKDNIMAEGYYEQENPSILWVIERWSSKAELDKNQLRLKSGIAKPAKSIYVKDLEPLSKNEWRRKPGKDDKPITIMLFVDCKEGTEANFKTIYHSAMPLFRGEPGVVNYQLSQLEEDNTQFVTYEKFRNEEAFQYHLNFPPIQPVIDYLNTSIKKQPFQTGLHRLIEFAPVERN